MIREWSEYNRPREKQLKHWEYTQNPFVLSAMSDQIDTAFNLF